VNNDAQQNDARRASDFRWTKAEGQTVWIKIGLAFLLFYAAEAILFWQVTTTTEQPQQQQQQQSGNSNRSNEQRREGHALADPLMRLPGANPLLYPLGFWCLFGVIVYRLQRRNRRRQPRDAAVARFRRWQALLITAAITVGAIGVAFLVMRRSGNVTLGHVALFFELFLAAAVIGATELNIGWLAAAATWLLTAIAIYCYPAGLRLTRPFSDEDVLIGLAVTAGFFLIGAFPHHVDRRWLDEREDANSSG
jgi:hypothetical protein